MDRDEAVKKLRSKLTEKRFVHSVGVEYTAGCMAFIYDVDVKRARCAGLLHDRCRIPVGGRECLSGMRL